MNRIMLIALIGLATINFSIMSTSMACVASDKQMKPLSEMQNHLKR